MIMSKLTKVFILPTLLVFMTSSGAGVSEFVSSGEYERMRELVADCSRPFFPAHLGEEGRGVEKDGGIRLAFYRAGEELRDSYEMVNMAEGEYHRFSDDEWSAIKRGPNTRLESFRVGDELFVSNSTGSAQSCTRLILNADPMKLQVGIGRTTIRTNASILQSEEYREAISGQTGEVVQPEIEPGEGQVVFTLYVDGSPKADHDVIARADIRGPPPAEYRTFGHEHLYHGDIGAEKPTLCIEGQPGGCYGSEPGPFYGTEVIARTDGEGSGSFPIRAGYRGGTEAIFARTTLGGDQLEAGISIVMAHRKFVHFAELFGYNNTVEPSDDFPFLLTGWTDRHYYNHWLRDGSVGGFVRQTLTHVWENDEGRIGSETPRYLQLNDMSLEYGGLFRLEDGNKCSFPGNSDSHKTHSTGVDFDVSPCYTEGPDGRTKISAGACEQGQGLKMDERLLVAQVIGYAGGAVLRHGQGYDRAPYHYHIRYPDPGAGR